MGQVKYSHSRLDAKKSSCSPATVVVVLGVCLVGVWMFMSSSVIPGQNPNIPVRESKTDSIAKVSANPSSQFEDNSGDLPEDAMKDGVSQENAQDEKSSDSEGNDDNEEPTSNNQDANTKVLETRTEDESSSSETETSKSKSENENGSSDTNEADKPDSEVKKIEERVRKPEDEKKTGSFPAGDQSEILKETETDKGAFSTQAAESASEKQSQKQAESLYKWKTCNVTEGPDFIPCLDNYGALRKLRSTLHYEHRERHCPAESPTCLIWYNNVPRTKLAEVKGHQNWVKVTGEYLTFPGGGTQFKNGALHYIDHIQKSFPDIEWGKRTRVILDVGCGVASFGGYLFERDVIAMSFAPKDEHEAQVQFALERGIPAISAVMGTQRLPFPSKVFDAIHCARCRVPWHIEGGKLLLELNRLLRPGGYFVWSATPVYQQEAEDVEIWEAMSKLTKAMCWERVVIYKDDLNQVGAAIYRKPTSNECYENRQKNDPPLCKNSDDPDAIWNIALQACMHKIPVDSSVRGSNWPKMWPERLESPPYWLKSTETGAYGKPAPEDFTDDYKHWKNVVTNSYLNGLGIDWSSVRNVMDMRSIYGGFAAALRDLNVWVMNVVPLDSPDTLPVIYERGLFGIYHNWCESFSTYPRTYDLLHADHLFSTAMKRCKLESIIAEVDRVLRPEGKLIVRDNIEILPEIENMVKSMHWNIHLSYNKEKEGLLCVEKTLWRPTEVETLAYTY
ncbi:ankyrin-like protein [Artemisia annua]|uniref:Methyltransferase n=1 Tax=Artemisia annua TaxID=35608 RepID=A0A2U1PVG6_ARTAN|nr:ankyrin-like protein [Artemisia annua]